MATEDKEENSDKLLYSREKIKQSLIEAMKEAHSVSIEKKLKSNNMLSVDVKGKTQGAIAVKTDMISEVEGEYVLDSIETIDKMTEIIVKNASFPLLLIIQPGVARNLFSNKQLNIKGVLARFLCYWTPSQQHQEGIVEIVSAQKHKKFILENYQNKIYQLLKRSCNFRKERKFIEIPLTSEAEDFLREKKRHYEKLMERSEYEFLSDWLGKAHGFLLRITGDIHCWNNPEAPELTPITKSEMLDAASLLDNLQKHAEYSFCPSQIAACEDAKRILLYFKYHKNIYPFFDSCILYQNIRGLNSVKVNIALNLMSQLYYIALIPKRRGGFFFFFYPNLHNFIYNKL